MKTKGKKIITSVAILIILISAIFVLLTACNKSTENNTNKVTTETTTELTTENISTEQLEYYNKVIEQCKNAIENDFYKDYSNEEIEKIKGEYLPYSVLGAVTEFNTEPKIYYTLHDIDKNGIPEMFIATKDDNGYMFQDIFTYADGKIYPLFGEYFGMCYHDVYSNGTITSYSSDEECEYFTFMRIAKDGHTLMYLDSLLNYSENGKNKYIRELINNDDDTERPAIEISKEEFDLIGKLYTGKELKAINEKTRSRSDINFEWIEIKW